MRCCLAVVAAVIFGAKGAGVSGLTISLSETCNSAVTCHGRVVFGEIYLSRNAEKSA